MIKSKIKTNVTNRMLKFPDGFLWGAGLSAYQTEGGILNNNWDTWFRLGKIKTEAGRACDHYHLYQHDFFLAKNLNLNALRISLEWARLEPKQGQWDKKEFEHYHYVLKDLKTKGFKVFLTIHHFTEPSWFIGLGGFEQKENLKYFYRLVEKVAQEYHDLVDFWLTINEPTIYVEKGYLDGDWPPQKKSLKLAVRVIRNLVQAHQQAYLIIKNIQPTARISLPLNIQYFEPDSRFNFFDVFIANSADYFRNRYFLNQVKKHLDFIGLNFYFYNNVCFNFKKYKNLFYELRNRDMVTTDLGWPVKPEVFYDLLVDLKKYHLPVYITENGIADAGDQLRPQFIISHLYQLHRAIESGVDLRGYLYWSLIDNFEWSIGFDAKFGLIEVDFKTMKRKIRPSASLYAKIINKNALSWNELRLII